ncbi:SAM-dependent methyltransferase [Pedobacter yonginense]|uniref:SAM-dependent methyltransferase n=1 Tax=Pedobacter yonginense TaxID=651869 RepID=A0A317EMC4_9SPHI|nr:class I SAM-dependent methyltransferase [Pedobacter yonginense]PWS26426.1 SAM-dependent methyltransferase [Pedobacter yonginense]
MPDVFNIYSSYYDLLYKDKDYEQEVDYILDLINRYQDHTTNIIEFGSGTGKHASILASKGFDVVGIEPSEEMIKIANAKSKSNLSFVQSSIESYNGLKHFDVAISLFHVMSYLTTNEDLKKAFANVNNSLKTGGIFIFDIWYSPAVLTQLPEKRTKSIENEVIKVLRHATPEIHWNSNVIDVNYHIEVLDKMTNTSTYFDEIHKMRHFSIPEIKLLADVSGFKVVANHEFLTAKQPGADTWGVCFVLQKI